MLRTEDAGTGQEPIARAARALVRRYDWHLVDDATLAACVADRLRAPAPAAFTDPPDLLALCEQEASALLFAACEHGALLSATPRERVAEEFAYRDLHVYLTALAPHLPSPAPGAVWEDLVQNTLIAIRRQHPTCRDPRAFLAWASGILRRWGAATWRRGGREVSLDVILATEGEVRLGPGGVASEPRDRHVDPEGDQALLRILHDCLDNDEERMYALCSFFFGLKRRELGMVFDKPLANFDRLGMAVKRKLRACGDFLALVGRPSLAA